MILLKRISAFTLALLLMFVIASCSNNTGENQPTTTMTKTDPQLSGTTETTAPTNATTLTAASTTIKTATATTSTSTDSNNCPLYQIYETIPPVWEHTTDKNGNPSKAFIKSLKGYTLKILNPYDNHNLVSGLYESDLYVETQVEKKYGVNIEISGGYEGYYETVLADITSGKPEADIYKVQDINFNHFLNNGYMADLNVAMQKSGVDMKEPWYDQDARVFFNINNKQYGWADKNTTPHIIYYNKDMIKKAGLTDPAELVVKKQWTWYAMESYAQKLSTDNVIGLSCGTNYLDFLASMVSSAGDSLLTIQDQKLKPNVNSVVSINCLNAISRWSQTSVLDLMQGQTLSTAAPAKFAKGEMAMILGGDISAAVKKEKSTFTIGVVPFPVAKSGWSYISQRQIEYVDFIPAAKAASAAKILFIRNEMYREDWRFWDRNLQIKSRYMFLINGKEVENYANLCFDRNGFRSYTNFIYFAENGRAKASSTLLLNRVLLNGKTPQQAIDEYGTVLDEVYESAWKGCMFTGK